MESRRLFVKRAVTATGGLWVAASLPSLARADCAGGSRQIPLGAHSGDGKTTFSGGIASWSLGDCVLSGCVIKFGNGFGTFDAKVRTNFTHDKDIWHFRLQLFNGTPDPKSWVLKFDRSWDGPQMSEHDNPRDHPWHENFTYDRSLDAKPVIAVATSCC
jgi:hypothetical protein